MNRTFQPITDLRAMLPKVRDQGNRPTCVAFAVTTSHEYYHNHDSALSEEFLYRCCKIRDKNEQDGTNVVNALGNLQSIGQVEEVLMPYQQPLTSSVLEWMPLAHFRSAKQRKVNDWGSLPKKIDEVEQSICREKPVICVLQVTDDFYVPKNFFIDYTQRSSGQLPLHAVVFVGYGIDNVGQPYFIMRNSWGSGWSHNGYAFLSYQYYLNCWRGNWVIKA